MMRFYLGVYILLTAVAIEVSCDCGVALPPANSSDTLEDGIDAAIFPWYVDIYEEVGFDLELTCSGTLISSDVVITAATCLNRTRPEIDVTRLFVVTGNHRPRFFSKTSQESYGIQTYYRTIGYPATSSSHSGDLVWFILEHPLNVTSSFGPACIDLDVQNGGGELPVGTVGQITYRPTLEIMGTPEIRRMEIIPFSHVHCYVAFREDRRQNSSLNPFCARLSNNTAVVHNIIGGGFYTQRNGRWYISAVMTHVSYVVDREETFIVAVFMNIDRYADEINKQGIITRCGGGLAQANPLVAHGFQTELGMYPWHVAVYQINSTGFHDQMCAGSLVTSKVVLSAAHCFFDEVKTRKEVASSFAVAAGKLYRLYDWPERFAQKSAVQSIHLLSKYRGLTGNYAEDIAWLILQHPFFISAFVMPICMDFDNTYESEDLQVGQLGKIAGWGRTAAGVFSNELQEVQLPFTPYNTCISALPENFIPFITPDKFCAGYLNGTGVCDGDSGGGLAFRHDGLWYLRGIVSLSYVSEPDKCPISYTALTNVGRFIDEHQRIVNISTYRAI